MGNLDFMAQVFESHSAKHIWQIGSKVKKTTMGA
jgi:hypothetical protein